MARTARRSVASDPSSPTEYQRSASAEASASASSAPSLPTHISADPLRPNGSPYTTKTLPKINGTADATPFSNRFQNGNSSTPPPAQNFNGSRIIDPVAAERERVRMEFYATYDVMTGVRIAATLGGFFGLMVFLVVYKSRGESQETIKALKDPKIAAVAAAVMQEEEDRELQEAMEATGMSIYPDDYDHIGYRRERLMSVGNVSAPPVFNRGYRFSSLGGGYSSLLGPPARRFSYSESGRRSTSVSSRVLSAFPMGGSFGIEDYFQETDGDEGDDEFDQITTASAEAERPQIYLSVPPKGQESRRSSDITCCSSDSSYLERRCSAMTLGLTPLPPISSENPSRRQSLTDTWDYYYPGIQVVQPTPKTSPVPSEKSLPENSRIGNGSGRHKSLIEQESLDSISVYTVDDQHLPVDAASASATPLASPISTTSTVRSKLVDTSTSCCVLDNSQSSFNVASSSSPPPQQVQQHPHHIIRRAPLASLSSFKISSIDYQDSDLKSLGSDSVFAESYADTDDEMEQFSTDSDEITDAESPPNTRNISSVTGIQSNRAHYPKTRHHPPPLRQGSMGSSTSSRNSTGTSTMISAHTAPATVQPIASCTSVNENWKSIRCTSGNADGKKNSASSIGMLPKSRSVQLVKTFETKAIIERHQPQQQQQQLQLIHPQLQSVTRVSLLASPSTTTTATFNSGGGTSSSGSCVTLTAAGRPTTARTAGFSGCSSNSISNHKKHSNQNNKINNKSSECIDINVVVVENRSIVSPSVILELPVISTQEVIDDPPIDPSLPGASRKWSKETLF